MPIILFLSLSIPLAPLKSPAIYSPRVYSGFSLIVLYSFLFLYGIKRNIAKYILILPALYLLGYSYAYGKVLKVEAKDIDIKFNSLVTDLKLIGKLKEWDNLVIIRPNDNIPQKLHPIYKNYPILASIRTRQIESSDTLYPYLYINFKLLKFKNVYVDGSIRKSNTVPNSEIESIILTTPDTLIENRIYSVSIYEKYSLVKVVYNKNYNGAEFYKIP